jgi:hypothetical protein
MAGNHRSALSTSWVGMRMGIDPFRVNAMRRAGELYAVRKPGSQDWLFPTWQFGPDWKPLASVQRILRAARDAGYDDSRLEELFNRRVGIVGARRSLVDVLLDGDEATVLAEIERSRVAG